MYLTSLLTTLTLFTVGFAAPTTTDKRAPSDQSNHAQVINKCGFAVYIWHVDSAVGSVNNVTTFPYSENLSYDPKTGTALKIGTSPTALSTGAPLIHFSYALNPAEGSVYYDLSTVFGLDPAFQGKKFVLKGTEGLVPPVPVIEWSGDGPSGTRAYFGNTDLNLTLCA
jgi:hypothetical protein